MRTILIVDDLPGTRDELSHLLRDEGYDAIVAESAEKGLQQLDDEAPDLVLLDVNFPAPGFDGLEMLARMRQQGSRVPVIIMSDRGTIAKAVQATQLGALDFLEKDADFDPVQGRLLVAIRNALESVSLERKTKELVAELGAAPGLVGDSEPMRRLRVAIERAAAAEARVLITGENGTGKELVARALHEESPRARAPFVKVNCAAIPHELIESELFGHEKGAFTGAASRRIGRIESADGGSLLLDEVGDMALEAQAKLLRALEEGEIERVGGQRAIRVDVRVIAATNKNLEEAIAAGRFREDLYYRLNVVPILVPALRERREDIPALVEHLRARFQRESGRPLREIDRAAITELQAWSWPGNVRELRNVIERLEIMTDGDVIGVADVHAIFESSRPLGGGQDAGPGELPLRELLERTERDAIREALRVAAGTVSEAARRLGLDRANLHRKMRRLGIEREDGEGVSD